MDKVSDAISRHDVTNGLIQIQMRSLLTTTNLSGNGIVMIVYPVFADLLGVKAFSTKKMGSCLSFMCFWLSAYLLCMHFSRIVHTAQSIRGVYDP